MMLCGQRTYAVNFEDSHLRDPRYFAWLRDLEVVKHIGRDELLRGITFPEVESYVAGLRRVGGCTFLAVYAAEERAFIGTAKINFLAESGIREGVADIGIMIGDRSFWGRGMATDILRSVSKYAFDELGARKLVAGAMSPNIAVIRAFENVGYVREGLLRSQFNVAGSHCDHVLLGCFNAELKRA